MLNSAISIIHLFDSRRISLVLFISFLLCIIPTNAQNISNVERSTEAIALIQRVLAASGGNVSSETIRDLVATGTSSTPMDSKDTTESPVIISMRGLDQLRVDSTLPKGTRSIFNNRGGLSSKDVDGTVAPLGNEDVVESTSHFFPLWHLAGALNDSSYSVTIPETVIDEESGHNLYHLRLQRIRSEVAKPARAPSSSAVLDYYIDTTTSYIVRVQNLHSDRGVMPTSSNRGPFEIYRFSDYRLDCGILLPHQIMMLADRRLISTIHLSGYQINTGISEGNFIPTSNR